MNYKILPFRFARFNEEGYLLSNDVGEYIFLKNDDFHKFVNGELDPTSELFYDIASKQIATTDQGRRITLWYQFGKERTVPSCSLSFCLHAALSFILFYPC